MSLPLVNRFILAGAYRVSHGPDYQPDVFERTPYLVAEIAEAITRAGQVAINLGGARAARSLEAMDQHQVELCKLLGQAMALSMSLRKVLDDAAGAGGAS